ncbi:MAG: hypothetical protein CMK09_01455 [Ponticaulis sp.]|nr:hypothetical protein [Ponticaulis sp.]|tara:strand:+ start:1708 stop:3822 length:2115 start_codon:yes stop_codon:yes gene_type:complete
MRHLKYAMGFAALGAVLSLDATAQTEPDEIAAARSVEGVRTFHADYFEQYNPITAFDMVSRVPGFEIDNGENRRGFGGTAGNILVNGDRPSSKDDVSEQLKRIPAGSVDLIELISGSSANVDIRGQTQIVNVILRDDIEGGSPTTWVFELRDIQYSERPGWTVQLTKTFALGDTADLTLDFQTPNLRGRSESFEEVRAADGTLLNTREVFGQPNQIGWRGSGVLNWKPTETDTVNFNARYQLNTDTQNIGVIVEDPSGNFLAATAGSVEWPTKTDLEIGGDWEHRFSDTLSAKLIGLASFNMNEKNEIYETYLSTGLSNIQTIDETVDRGERVARGFVSWQPADRHSLDFGLEGAFNYRDITLDIANDSGAGPVPVMLSVADTRVEEVRLEPFITHVWNMTESVTLESGFVFEVSRITQTGDEEKERDFSYPKPRLVGTWQASEDDQIRLSVERDIAQLDFGQFATSLNVVDSFSVVGNPDLEPEKTWKYRAEYERRFGNRGAVTLSAFHHQVDDVQDFIVIGTNDAFGNLGDGTRLGFELQGTTKFDFIPNSELRYSAEWKETKVTDPVTGTERRFTREDNWKYDVSYRQDLPDWKSAWGGSVSRGSEREFFRRKEQIFNETPNHNVGVFFETTAFFGVTMKLEATNIFHTNNYRTRTFFADDPNDPLAAPRGTGVVSSTYFRKQKGGPTGTQVFKFRVSGTF